MTALGADPDQLRSAAQRVNSLADDYQDANQQIEYWLRRMDWEGPEAARFTGAYRSRLRPQLDAVAAYLRAASGELRAQADQQTRVSSANEALMPAFVLMVPLGGGGANVAGGKTGDQPLASQGVGGADGSRLATIAALTALIHGKVSTFDTHASAYQYSDRLRRAWQSADGVRDLATLAKLTDLDEAVTVTGKLPAWLNRGLGIAGLPISAWALKGHIGDTAAGVDALWGAISQGDTAQMSEALEQLGYSTANVWMDMGGIVLTVGSLTGNPVVTAAGTVIFVTGAGLWVASAAFDHLRDPVGQKLKETYEFAKARVEQVTEAIAEAAVDIHEELAEARTEIDREVREAWNEVSDADGVVETGAEIVEGIAEVGYEVAEGIVETGIEAGETVGRVVTSPLRAIGSWLT